MEGGLLCWELYIYVRHVNKGFGNGACLSLSLPPSLSLSLLTEAPLVEPGGRVPILRTLRDM